MADAAGTPQDTKKGRGSSRDGSQPSSVTSGPAGSGAAPAPAVPAPGSSGGGPDRNNSKRRRGLGVVTPNACTECRKKRAKCDGQKPCARCRSQGNHVECVYEVPVRQSKDNLRNEIEQLRHKQRSSDQVLAALVRPELWQEVLHRLRNGQSVENISEWLGAVLPSGGGALPSFLHAAGDARASQGGNMATQSFVGTGSGAIPTANLGDSGSTPATSQQQAAQMDENSPWHFSNQSGVSTTSESHPDMMNWTTDTAPPSRVGSWAENTSQAQQSEYRGVNQVLAPLDSPDMKSPASTWTKISGDSGLVQHLLALYFCWEYPTFASLSKEHFLRDFQGGTDRYCSSILVNALLALGCRFSTQPSTRANPDDPYSSGDHFFKEALRLFHLEDDHRNLTTIQALGIMSIREASCGRDSESWYYAGQSIRLAIEMGLHRIHDDGDQDEVAVQSATFWGAFALDHAWSLATGSLPQSSCFTHLPPKPAIIGDIEASLWIPYTDDGAPLQRPCEQPSNVRSVYKCFCELSELVHQSLYILHSPGRPLSSRDLLNIYTKYLNWYDSIPEVLRLGHNFTPAVLFAHMYYHFAILLLFRPLIKMRILGSKVLPRDVCSQAADAIQGLLRSYASLYTLRRTPSFVPYFVLTSAIMHLAIGASSTQAQQLATSNKPPDNVAAAAAKVDPRVSQSISQGIKDLTEMAPCHHFAEQALNILRFLAKKWKIDVDLNEAEKSDAEGYEKLGRPITNSLNFFAPNVQSDDFMCSWGNTHPSTAPFGGLSAPVANQPVVASGPGQGAPGQTEKSGNNMENPLFWPFPMQGRPMLPTGQELRDAGFAML